MICIIFLQNYYCVKPLKINYLTKYWHIFFKVLQPPKANYAFPPYFRFPPILQHLSECVKKISCFHLFNKNFSFLSGKISDELF